MSEIQDWGDEPAKDGQDAKRSALTDPDAVPRGWRPAASTIRAIQGVSEPEEVGGLSAESGPVQSSLAEKQFDPLTLLEMKSISIDQFFSLDRDAVYHVLHRLQSLPDGNPKRDHAIRVLTILAQGKEKYLKDHPDAQVVDFTV